MRRLLWIGVFLALFLLEGKGQQTPIYSQYMLNGFLLNPAVAGSEGYTAVNLTAREQWVGMEHGPGTYALSFQTRILKNSYISKGASVRKRRRRSSRSGQVGLGGYFFNDRNGAMERIGVKGTYAYHIKMSHSQLSFGLTLAGYNYRVNENLINLADPGDQVWLGVDRSIFIPDADFGTYYSARDLWAGFSVENLLESTLKLSNAGTTELHMERTYYLMGGYDFEINRDWDLSTSTLFKFAENVKFQWDLNAKMIYDQEYWGGLGYRTGHSIINSSTLVVMLGVSVDRLIFGYSYDIGLNSTMKYSFGTHEFTFVAKFGDSARRYRWLNRF